MAGSRTPEVFGFQLEGHHCGEAGHLHLLESNAESLLGLGCRTILDHLPQAETEAAGGTGPAPRQPELGSIQANAHGSGSQGQFHNGNIQ